MHIEYDEKKLFNTVACQDGFIRDQKKFPFLDRFQSKHVHHSL